MEITGYPEKNPMSSINPINYFLLVLVKLVFNFQSKGLLASFSTDPYK